MLIHCHFAIKPWAVILKRFEMTSVMPRKVSELFHQWRITSSMKRQHEATKVVVEFVHVCRLLKVVVGEK